MILDEKPPLNDALLQHFGIRGMKWGVRNEREGRSDRKYREKSQAQFRKEASDLAVKRAEKIYSNKGLTRDEYGRLATNDLLIERGSTVTRFTRDPNREFGKGNAYVTTNAGDAATYRALLSTQTDGGDRLKKYKDSYEVTYQNTQTLRSPSEKARVDAFVKLMDSPEVKLADGTSITGRQWLKDLGYGPQMKKVDSHDLGLQFYKTFTEAQGMQNNPMNTAYFNSLKKKGYNAVVDDNDRNIVSRDPWVVMDAGGNLKRVGVKALTTREILDAQRNVKFPANVRD